MQTLLNDLQAVAPDMLEGAVALAPGQVLLDGWSIVPRADMPPTDRRTVAVTSGGGTGRGVAAVLTLRSATRPNRLIGSCPACRSAGRQRERP